MPRSSRQEVIRKHQKILGYLEKAILGLADLASQFQEHHPDYAMGYTTLCKGLYQILELFKLIMNHV